MGDIVFGYHRLKALAREYPVLARAFALAAVLAAVYISGVINAPAAAGLVNVGPVRTFFIGLTHPVMSLIVLAVLFLFAVLASWLTSSDDDADQKAIWDDSRANYGYTKALTPDDKDELKKYFDVFSIDDERCTMPIVGWADKDARTVYTIKPELPGNRHTLYVGASGDGKTINGALVRAFQEIRAGHSIIVTDASGEMFEYLYATCIEHGYEVRFLNFYEPNYSDGFDAFRMFDICREEGGDLYMVGSKLADYMAANAAKENNYFTDETKKLLAWLMTYIYYTQPKKIPGVEHGLGKVLELVGKDTQELVGIVSGMDRKNPAYKASQAWLKAYEEASKTRGKRGTDIWLGQTYSDAIRTMLTTDDIDFRAPGKRKCAYFVALDVTGPAKEIEVLEGLYLNIQLAALIELAQHYGKNKQLDVPVTFIGDEMISAVTVPNFDSILKNVRKHLIDICLPLQEIPSLELRYDKAYKPILNNCSWKYYYGSDDEDTIKYFEKLSGTGTYIDRTGRYDPFLGLPTGEQETVYERAAIPADHLLHALNPYEYRLQFYAHKCPPVSDLLAVAAFDHPYGKNLSANRINTRDYHGYKTPVPYGPNAHREAKPKPVEEQHPKSPDTGMKNAGAGQPQAGAATEQGVSPQRRRRKVPRTANGKEAPRMGGLV